MIGPGFFDEASHRRTGLRRNSQLPKPGHEVLLRPITLHSVTVGTQQLQVSDVVSATDALGDDVVDLEHTERELAPASVASAFLLAEQDVLVVAIRH